MANRQEETVDRDVNQRLVRLTLAINQVSALHTILTKKANRIMLEHHLDIRCIEYTLLHHLRGTQIGLTYDQIYLFCQTGKIDRLLTSGITATNDSYILLTIKEAVASRTGRNTHARILLLICQAQIFSGRTRRDNQGLCLNHLLSINRHLIGRLT